MKVNEKTLCIEFEPKDCDANLLFAPSLGLYLETANQKLREFMEGMPIYYGRKMDDADQYILGAEEEKGDEIKTRLIGPVPIVRDTAESLLKEMVDGFHDMGITKDYIDRAKAIFERGEE